MTSRSAASRSQIGKDSEPHVRRYQRICGQAFSAWGPLSIVRQSLLLAIVVSLSMSPSQAGDTNSTRATRAPLVTRFPVPAKPASSAVQREQAKPQGTIMRLPPIDARSKHSQATIVPAKVDQSRQPDVTTPSRPTSVLKSVKDDTNGTHHNEDPIPTFSIRPAVLATSLATPPDDSSKTPKGDPQLSSVDDSGNTDRYAIDDLGGADQHEQTRDTVVASDEKPDETERERLLRILSESSESETTDFSSDPKVLAMIQGLRLPSKVAQQASAMVDNAIRLARLGASHSARSEFTQALRLTAQALDAQIDRQVHSQALSSGFTALDEAEDFARPMGCPEEDLQMASLIAGHRTPILKDSDLSAIPPLVAMEKYYEFAYRQLSIAGGEEAAASKALFALAKLDDFQATRREVTHLYKAPRLIALYQASLTIFPQNPQAANELGVQLAATGQLQAAGEALRHGLRMAPTATLWKNLAEVHRRLGEPTLALQAENESRLAARVASTPTLVAPQDLVQWVTPKEFARTPGPQNMTPVAQRPLRTERSDTVVR